MAKFSRKKAMNVPVWILLGLLILGLMGFGIGNYSGVTDKIGSVGDEEITVDEYYQALQEVTRNLSSRVNVQLTYPEAISLGADREAIGIVSRAAALDNEAYNIGISVGDNVVLEQIRNEPGFRGLDGNFDTNAYNFTLQNLGMSGSEFDEVVRKEISRSLLSGSLLSDLVPSEVFWNKYIDYNFHRRTFRWIEITDDMVKDPDPQATDSDLRTLYDENPEDYTLPSSKEITYVWLTPDMISSSFSVSDEELQTLYDARIDDYKRPESRIVDRLVFPTAEEASLALDQINSGITDFDQVVIDSGIRIEDIDLGEVFRSDLSIEVGDLLFSTDELSVLGPVQSSVGPALFRINGIISAKETSFEDAREELMVERSQELAIASIQSNFESYQDSLAAGATLEELAQETDLVLATVQYNALSNDPITEFATFRNTAVQIDENSFPELMELENGGVMAMRLDQTIPPALQPFESVRDEVESNWVASEFGKQKVQLAEEHLAALEGGAPFGAIGLGEPRLESGVLRIDGIDDAPQNLLQEVFEIDVVAKGAVVSGENNRIALVLLDEILPPDEDSEEFAGYLSFLESQITGGLSRDIINSYTVDLINNADFEINQEILNSVHSQLQ
ncbi:MAG: hypothetical protein F4073_05320 [Rhodobacteraceae bacterium]|nr:hypothetical protein [Paracoccaceae bacterium]MYF45917.1 hypothetical protein [Paracoccaceae bacterium]MYI91358.1 hypothetical protein [Paracoccaceae bacterium]